MTRRLRFALLSGLVLVVLVGVSVFGRGDDPTYTPLDVGARHIADIEYGVPGHGPDTAHRLDVYLPAPSPNAVPAVIWIHGGGWINGDKSDPMGPWDWTDDGVAVVSINYRLAEGSTLAESAADVDAAVAHVLRHGSEWGIDTDRVGVYGHSAGGHLAALVAASEHPLVAVVAAGAPLELVRLLDPDRSIFVGLDGEEAVEFVSAVLGCDGIDDACRELAGTMSPARIPSDSTPVLVIHGDADRFVAVDQARAHADAHGDNPMVTVRVVPGSDHIQFRAEANEFLTTYLFA